jgi:molecular chaperone HscC
MIIGIDLGTTNRAAAYWADGAPRLIPNRLGESLTPSAVGLDDDGKLLVGRPARERMASHAGLTATSFKRYMGTQHRIALGKTDYGAEELSAMVLRSLKEDAEAHLGEAVTEAVITVPAYFNDKQRKATRRGLAVAGVTGDDAPRLVQVGADLPYAVGIAGGMAVWGWRFLPLP